MRSIEKRFEKIKKVNPDLGDIIILAKTVSGQDYARKIISRQFAKSVSKEDYASKEKQGIINYLFELSSTLSKPLEEGRNMTKIAPEREDGAKTRFRPLLTQIETSGAKMC